jgi:hypothetical protein
MSEILTAKRLVTQPRSSDVEIATGNLKVYKLPGTDQLLAEVIGTGGNTLSSDVRNLLIIFGIVKNSQSSVRNILLSEFIKK